MKRHCGALLAVFMLNAQASTCFDEQALAQLVERSRSKPQLIYVWSPRAVLSVEQTELAQRSAASFGMDFTAVHSSSTSDEPAGTRSQALCAASLIEREALRHFPSAFVLSQARIHPHPIVGAMPAQAWRLSLKERLAP
jgi:hypothetical protein